LAHDVDKMTEWWLRMQTGTVASDHRRNRHHSRHSDVLATVWSGSWK